MSKNKWIDKYGHMTEKEEVIEHKNFPRMGSDWVNENNEICRVMDIKSTLIFLWNFAQKKYEFCFIRFFYGKYK